MHTNKAWWMLTLTLTAGCVADIGEPIDEEEAIDEEEDLGVVQQAIEPGAGVVRCNSTQYSVHQSQPAGNRAQLRDSAGTILETRYIACHTMGLSLKLAGGKVWEVVADSALTNFSQNKPTCGACFQYQGPQGDNPPNGTPPVMYSMMLSFPTTIMNLGVRGGSPGGGYYFGNNGFIAAFNPTSWCDNSFPTYGRLTNAWGFELVNGGGFSEWGTKAYQMWDPTTATTRAASVGAGGLLQNIPWSDVCG